MTSGSATVAETRKRGSSDSYGILVDDLHAATKRAQVVVREARDVDAVEGDTPRVRLDEPQDRLRGRRLAASRLPDERDHLAPRDRKRHARDRVDEPLRPAQDRAAEPARDAVADDEVVDLEERTTVLRRLDHAATSTELAK